MELCKFGSLTDVREALRQGANPNQRGVGGQKSGGEKVEGVIKRNSTVLMLAVQEFQHTVVELLLEQPGLEINLTDKLGFTALHYACADGNDDLVRMLLGHPGLTSHNLRDVYGYTPLIQAVFQGGPYGAECARLLLEVPGLELELRDSRGRTPWSWNGGQDSVEALELVRKKVEERRLGQERQREEAMRVMTDDKIEEIIQLLEPIHQKANKLSKDKKTKSNQKKIGNKSKKTNTTEDKPCSMSQGKEGVCHENKTIEKEEKDILKSIQNKQLLLMKETLFSQNLNQTKGKEMSDILTKIDEAQNKKVQMNTEIAQIEERKKALMRTCLDEDLKIKKLKIKQEKLEHFMTKSLYESKVKMSILEQEADTLKSKLLKPNQQDKQETISLKPPTLPNQEYFESISKKIAFKEQELECPVCLDTATAPILMCDEQHLICSGCR